MYKQPVGGEKMLQVVQELWSVCSWQKSPTVFPSIKLPFCPGLWDAVRMARQQCDHSLSVYLRRHVTDTIPCAAFSSARRF